MSLAVEDTHEDTHLTDKGYWENFWASMKVPNRVNSTSSFDRSLCQALQRLLPEGQKKKLIEIGAAPGRWLIFLQEKFGYEVDGIEYSPSACRKTRENLEVCGTQGNVYQQDFFHNNLPKHSYDVVLSLGFIEHFTELSPVIEGHLALLKPGGHLVLGVPNLLGIHGAVERHTDPDTFATHNLEVMSLSFMKGLSSKYNLTPLWIGYIGGINPGLISFADTKIEGKTMVLRHSLVVLARFALRLLSFIRNRIHFLDHWNSPVIGNYLLAVYQYDPLLFQRESSTNFLRSEN